MNGGDTFVFCNGEDPHLWIVVSDPTKNASEVLIANVSTFRDGQSQCCILEIGEHPWITHRSIIRFDRARVCPLSKLENALRGNRIQRRSPLNPDILLRIRRAALESDDTIIQVRRLLLQQGS